LKVNSDIIKDKDPEYINTLKELPEQLRGACVFRKTVNTNNKRKK